MRVQNEVSDSRLGQEGVDIGNQDKVVGADQLFHRPLSRAKGGEATGDAGLARATIGSLVSATSGFYGRASPTDVA